MKILLYGINYLPELTGIGKYSGEMCEWLAKQNHDVRVICAPPYYPEWTVRQGYASWQYQVQSRDGVTVYRCPLFVPNQPSTVSRLLHLLSFSVSSLPVLFRQWFWKPDVVICLEPTFFCVPAALVFCKLRGSRSMLHIQDFELDAMIGLGMGKTGFVVRMAKAFEGWLMRSFGIISSISYSMLKNAEMKLGRADKLFYFPNWVDTDFLTPNCDASQFRERWGISTKTKVVLYSGNIGKKQGLEIVLRAAEILKGEPDLLFIMVGSGAAQSELMQLAKQMQLKNLAFYPLQAYEDLPSLMALGNIHLVVQKRGAADAVLPSKLTAILAVGGECVITADANTELGLLCQKYPGIARCIEPENADVLAATLREMLFTLPENNSRKYNKVAHQFALDNLKKEQILSRLVSKLSEYKSSNV
jgi:colanic acid biosynthesis glycosyl transferase WcaI